MSQDLEGLHIIVTGAGAGIGRSTALAVARRGASVLCTDLNAEGLAITVDQIKGASPDVKVVSEVLDSTDFSAAEQVIEKTAQAWGEGFDALVNVAGIMLGKALLDCDLDDLDRTFRINVGGAMLMTRAAAPKMPDGGVIVNVSSSSANNVTPGLGLYGASKAANTYLTRAFAVELANQGIRVIGIGPGAVDTDMPRRFMPPGEEGEKLLAAAVEHSQVIPRLASPDEVAEAICFLLSSDASFMTATTMWFDGGTTAGR